MKIRLVFLGMLFSQLLLAQNTNSDLVQLQNHPQKDTTRCFLLNKIIEAENDQNIWIKHNQELRKIAVDQLQKENTRQALFYRSRHAREEQCSLHGKYQIRRPWQKYFKMNNIIWLAI